MLRTLINILDFVYNTFILKIEGLFLVAVLTLDFSSETLIRNREDYT